VQPDRQPRNACPSPRELEQWSRLVDPVVDIDQVFDDVLVRGVRVLLGYRFLTKGEEVDERLAKCSRTRFRRAELGEHGQKARRHLLVVIANARQNIGERSLDALEPDVGAVRQRAA
jgi:hypothetical protein